MKAETAGAVAIIGMSFELGSCRTFAQLTDLLRTGSDTMTRYPSSRVRESGLAGSADNREGGWMPDVSGFDHCFFGLTRESAGLIDPRHRRALQACVAAVGNAGHALADLSGARVGVSVAGAGGPCTTLFDLLDDDTRQQPEAAAGSANHASARLIAQHLQLQGPAVVFDTACASFMTALHEARRWLTEREVDLALVTGTALVLGDIPSRRSSAAGLGVASPRDRCHPFDAASDGTAIGEGAGCLLLKRLDDARADRNTCHAVIVGSASNQDGGRSNGLSAPSSQAQTEVILAAWRNAGVRPEEIGYVEAHGTGTRIGDPIEIRGLEDAFATAGGRPTPCPVSSVKGNLGHLSNLAGLAGIARVIAQLRSAQIYPTAHFRQLNPLLGELRATRITSEQEPWPAAGSGRTAGISSFGLSGTNVHVVLQSEPPPAARRPCARTTYLFPLSARSPEDLSALRSQLCETIEAAADTVHLAAVAEVLALGREHHAHRFACLAATPAELSSQLSPSPTATRAIFSAQAHGLDHVATDYLAGRTVAWATLYPDGVSARVELPTPPFDEVACWPRMRQRSTADHAEILGLARSILERPHLGLHDDFFLNGGSPRHAAELLTECNSRYGIALDIEDLAGCSDLQALVALCNLRSQPQDVSAPAAGLSGQQLAIWVADQLSGRPGSYNVGSAFMFHGPVAARWLQGRLERLVAEQEMLRACVRDGPSGPEQVVLPPSPLTLIPRELDLTSMPFEEGMRRLRTEASRIIGIPIDPRRSPTRRIELLRARLETGTRDVLVFVCHHLFFDGMSWRIVMEHLSENPAPPTPMRTYRAFVGEQQRRLGGGGGRRLTAFWRDYLRDLEPHGPLPHRAEGHVERTSAGAQEDNTGAVAFRLVGDQHARLDALARARRGSLAIALLAAWSTTLWAVSDQTEFRIATMVAGRAAEDFGTVGCYVNTVFTRVQIRPGESFDRLFDSVRRSSLAAIAHSELPTGAILEAIGETGQHLSDVSFDFKPGFSPLRRAGVDGPEAELLELASDGAKFGLGINCVEYGDSVIGALEYSAQQLGSATAERYRDQFLAVLSAVVAKSDIPLHALRSTIARLPSADVF